MTEWHKYLYTWQNDVDNDYENDDVIRGLSDIQFFLSTNNIFNHKQWKASSNI